MGQVTIGKWGNNLAVRLPGDIAQALGIHEGERMDVSVADDQIVIRRADPAATLATLFVGGIPDEWRGAYEDVYEWGPDVGREVVPE